MAYLFDTGIFAANDSSGASLSGAKLTFYDNGTTTLKNTYPTKADAEAGTNANANPVVADANGRWGAIWLDDTFYTVKFQPADGSFTRTRDDIGGALADLASTASGKGAALVAQTVLGVNIKDYAGYDPTGVSSQVATFQAAIDATPNSGIQVIHVPRGTYLGDMTTLSYGSRTVVWEEQGGVTYLTAAPVSPATTTTVVRRNTAVGGDTTRPWAYGNSGFTNSTTDGTTNDRPTLRVARAASHTGGTTGGSANPSALSVINTVGANVQNYENAIVAQITSNLAQTSVSPNLCVVQGVLFKEAASTGGFFGANFVARDETKLGTTNSKGSLVAMELDVVASGPDATNVRIGQDIIGRGYDASADGATSMYAGSRVRSANSGVLSSEPMAIAYGYLTSIGTLGSIDTHFMATGACGANSAHFEAFSDSSIQGIFKIGSQRKTAGQTTAQLALSGWNASNSKVNYGRIDVAIVTATAGSEDGSMALVTRRAGAATNELTASGGIQIGAPTGGSKGVGTINCQGDIYKQNTAYTNPDYVFEMAYTGRIERFAANPGAASYSGAKSIEEIEAVTRETLRLPGFHDEPTGVFERGDMLLEKLEEAYLCIFELNRRLKVLEG